MADAAFTAGQSLTAASLNAQLNTVRWRVQKATQTVTNSTTLVASNDLTFAVEANTSYVFDSLIAYFAGTVCDFLLGWTLPTGSAINYSPWCSGVGAASGDSFTASSHDWIATNPVVFGGGDPSNMTARPSGVMTTGSTPGNFVWTFAQSTADTSNAKLLAGSWVMLAKVS